MNVAQSYLKQVAKVKSFMIAGVIVISLGGLYSCLYFSSTPPRRDLLIANFLQHRGSYERLRDMLKEDIVISRFGAWGYQDRDSMIPNNPPKDGISTDRFGEYISLLKDIEADGVYSARIPMTQYCVSVWGSGWATGTRHISICWLDNSVGGQPGHVERPKTFQIAIKENEILKFTGIEDDWYLEED